MNGYTSAFGQTRLFPKTIQSIQAAHQINDKTTPTPKRLQDEPPFSNHHKRAKPKGATQTDVKREIRQKQPSQSNPRKATRANQPAQNHQLKPAADPAKCKPLSMQKHR
ncbi:MAG: hypothetical protein V6Z82_03540 [Flavobacteriales bacterium]